MIVLTVQELFRRIRDRQDEISCNVAVSYLEVYNERIRDLLKPSSGELTLREDKKGMVMKRLHVLAFPVIFDIFSISKAKLDLILCFTLTTFVYCIFEYFDISLLLSRVSLICVS